MTKKKELEMESRIIFMELDSMYILRRSTWLEISIVMEKER